MRHTHRTHAAMTIAIAAAVVVIPPSLASAHEGTSVGKLAIEVGFVGEPAYVGQPNGVQLILTNDGKAVKDLGDGITVEIGFGDETTEPHTLAPWFFYEDGVLESGNPGEYRFSFIPSQPGAYTFHFQGKVDGRAIDESFTSSSKGFSEVEDPAAASFPAVTAPANAELATRIEQEAQRADDAITQAQAATSTARSAADSARAIAVIAVLLGSIGVIAGIAGLATRKRA